MSDSPNAQVARWIPLLVVGMSLNAVGIALTSLGWPRFVLMGAGILLVLVAVVQVTAAAKRPGTPPRDP